MRFAIILSVAASTGVAAYFSGCTTIDCGKGTIERNGTCEPQDIGTDPAHCGSGTVLVGDRCQPTIHCGPGTTMEPDPSDPDKVVCVGTGGSAVPCGQAMMCPTPATGKQTICGQLYNIEDNSEFRGPGATGAQCNGSATSGPCALSVTAYDALDFGANPGSAVPLMNSGTYIDDCGRYQVTDIAQPVSPFIGLGFDDTTAGNKGPGGVTNTVGVATAASPDTATEGLEAWVAPSSTTDMWTSSGGPPVSGGIYVAIFRAHRCDASTTCTDTELAANQSGVTITKQGTTLPNNDFYFPPTQVGHTSIDTNATSTGSNGTGLLNSASVNDGLMYSGTGGIGDTANCKWELKAAAAIPNIVFFQVYRPTNVVGHQCNQ